MPDKTIVILRINAKNMETEKAINELKNVKNWELKDLKEEEIGFGIKIIKAAFLIKEKEEKAMEELLKEVSALKSVEEAEIEGMTLL